ncbi:unnamed protein product [Lasius platythorax]|uniref:Uncharacterized protein n=1 Tax=Lasius platythorax TaxID=488582 RepID=A0AAV2P4M6_9HYME
MNHRAGDLDSVTSGDSWRTLVASEMGETTQAGRLFQRWRDSFPTNWRTSGRQVETRPLRGFARESGIIPVAIEDDPK